MKKILVANRGEIALSALRCIREMGLESATVYSRVDADSLHVRYADRALPLAGARTSRTYGSIQQILEAAAAAGADAVYCGYGFLSESPEFAHTCRQKGITFIGPEPEVLENCHEKLLLLSKATQIKLPVPEHSAPVADEADLLQKAQDLGYPVLLKPVAGTGGRYIVKAYRKEDLLESYRAFTREQALKGQSVPFYLERYIRRAVHIEFPVLADRHGNAVQLGERECVVQRRFQKLISETPSVWLPAETREQMAQAALALIRSIGFTGCGAVEFMVDEKGRWYFMEINPRLQVEYALTEIVYGVEIIKEQIRIAAGEPLALPADAHRPRFHAIECRINAEDPDRDFQPSAGMVHEYYIPGGYGYSVLSSVQKGKQIDIYYDPMVMKLDCFAGTREEALAKTRYALEAIRLKGVKTNVPFLSRVVGSEAFAAGTLKCDLKLKDFMPLAADDRRRQEVAALVAVLNHELMGRFRTPTFQRNAPGSNVWGMSGRVELITRRHL
jgi:acetyl-CoA carboxylase biotin carboxylase subunit